MSASMDYSHASVCKLLGFNVIVVFDYGQPVGIGEIRDALGA
jgi:hypothetical protein